MKNGFNITQVRLDVLKAPGAEQINMKDATIKVQTQTGAATLAFNTSNLAGGPNTFSPTDADPVRNPRFDVTSQNPPGVTGNPSPPVNNGDDGINFSVKPIRDPDDSYPILNTRTDRFQARINFTGLYGRTLEPIEGGSDVSITIVTASGASTIKELTIPPTLPQKQGATLSV
jgi:hypothetical protein